MRVNKKARRTFVLLPLLAGLGAGAAVAAESILLVDDFSVQGESAIGTSWQGFTDRVMGGVSDMRAGYVVEDGSRALRMVGGVSLENNGGFVQVRLPLRTRGTFDASAYSGIAVEVKSTPGSYYVHLRTRGTLLPWQYYAAEIEPRTEWTRLEIPFDTFVPQSTRLSLNTGQLASIAVVGGNAEFEADISVRRIEFYR